MHGFGERPHYEPRELDTIFEKIVVEFLRKKYGVVEFPIATDDLTVLIEEHVKSIDLYADLTRFGASVEGVTIFARADRPKVLISEHVHKHENRLRTTLTHEFSHVHLHAYLFALLEEQPRSSPGTIACKRETIVTANQTDWREWQAGYGSGAMLMPRTHLMRIIDDLRSSNKNGGAITAGSPIGQALVDAAAKQFAVSREAARVRLSVLGAFSQ